MHPSFALPALRTLPSGPRPDLRRADGFEWIELVPVGLFVLDRRTGELLAINRCAERTFSLRRGRLLGRPAEQAFATLIDARMLMLRLRGAGDGGCIDTEWPCRGRLRSVQIEQRLTEGAPGVAPLRILAARDLTRENEARRRVPTASDGALRLCRPVPEPAAGPPREKALRPLDLPLPGSVRLSGEVLVIEDSPVDQAVICQMLHQFGLRVSVAVGALQGLRKLGEAHFDLVLMDIRMPGVDGIEALSWLRGGSGPRFSFLTPPQTPVIALTADALGADEARLLALGFDDCLSKPIRQSRMLAMLTHRLRPQASASDGASVAGAGAVPLPAAPAAAAALAPAAQGGSAAAFTADPSGQGAVLDAAALDRLRELDPLGKNQLLHRVAKAFHTSAARLMPQLHDALAAQDLNGIRHVAHTLKSSSASIGALPLSQHCAELESQIRLERVENLAGQVERIANEIAVVLKALELLMDAAA